ncbi:MAG: Eco57I restriction-modification methylase domain-containing protein [Anaerolineales bacterium]|nr:Eco57I restriction-modification methylase domain-containing protein [Anaerolineales bacterium]
MERTPLYAFSRIAGEPTSATDSAEQYRAEAYEAVDDDSRAENGQFFTPPGIAHMMAALFETLPSEIRLLDAGAGVGTLTAAFVDALVMRQELPEKIHVTVYEQEEEFLPYLRETLNQCRLVCERAGIAFTSSVKAEDFVDAASAMLRPRLLEGQFQRFNCAILNPPYKKIHSQSAYRKRLSEVGIETGNLYTAFLALVSGVLEPGGQMVAITPRSFCNGPYYKPFRKLFDAQMAFRQIHLFESRDKAFAEDDVLQENVVFHAVKQSAKQAVLITSSSGMGEEVNVRRSVAYERVINPEDPHLFIHITTSDLDQNIADRMGHFPNTLADLGLDVATGRVVDFRARPYLRQLPDGDSVPLIYPHHMQGGFIRWPDVNHRKPNAFVNVPETRKWLLTSGFYVVVRRFSSKEEPKRVNTAVYDPEMMGETAVAFENHVNVFHAWNQGITPNLARGLAVYLSSTLLDLYFRQFNGHTQVNATDLRSLLYPRRETLEQWGQSYQSEFPDQQTVDTLIELELKSMAALETPDPVAANKRVAEALNILNLLGLPRAQQNERSAMTLLALLNLTPHQAWSAAEKPLLGITPIMNFIREHYGVDYAPNTRETIRRQTVHQFVQAALVVENPDDPTRPVNSPKWCYQVEPTVFELLRQYGDAEWDDLVARYLETAVTLKERYARKRTLNRVPVQIAADQEISLSAGKHSTLIKQINEAFAPRFVPGGALLYVGDTGDKWGYFNEELLALLGVKVDAHGKMPDVIIYDSERDWVLLIEAVTSHGPVNPKRRIELEALFQPVKEKIVYVTAFSTKTEFARHVADISWETEVWIASNPDHLIHFDGIRFLGPYGSQT